MNVYETLRSQATQLESGLAYTTRLVPEKERIHLMIWKPKAKKPSYNYLVLPENVEKEIDEHNKRLIAHKQIVLECREKAKPTKEKMKEVEVGQIFYCSWGYEQTNIDYYQVTTIKNSMVGLRPIASKMTVQDSWASGKVLPVKDSFTGEEFFKRAAFWTGRISFTISSYSTARAWDGKEKSCSWWA